MSSDARTPLAAALLILMVISSFPLLTASAAAAAPVAALTAPAGIGLTIIPTILPADGNTYPALVVTLTDQLGNPSLASNTTTIFLSSSQQNVAQLPSSITIPIGIGFVVANITTSETPGTTTVTASASGIRSGQVVIATRTPSGYATHLKISPQPDTVFARPGGFGSLVIQLQDDTGLPARAAFNINVSLSSSNNGIAQLDSKWVIVPTGSDLAVVNYTSGYAIGQAFVTATASGFSAGTASLGVVGSPPYSIQVSAEPDKAVLSSTGRVVVWLTDPSGNPARAPSPVTVTLTSSNLTTASVSPITVVIPTGQISGFATYATTAHNGTATITASAQGLLSGFDTLTTFVAQHRPAALALFTAPNPILADNGAYAAVLVSIADVGGVRPDVVASATDVTITSSNTAVGTVVTEVVIPAGQQFAVANITSTYLVGSTVITASAQGLQSAQSQESAFGPIPVSVLVSPVASTISADGGSYSALTVSLQDAFGNPAVAPSDIVVQLASSRPDILTVTSPVIITAGQTYAFATVRTGLSPGAANVTASASGYSASSTLLTTVVPAPDKLALYVGPNDTVSSGRAPDALLTVQLQDINGFPARAQQATSVIITSSNATLLEKTLVLHIAAGADYASTYISTVGFGEASLTASSPGLGASSLTLVAVDSQSGVTLMSPSPFIYNNETATLTANVTALGHGVSGAHVQWFTDMGTLSSANSTTNAAGLTSVSLASSSSGVAEVRALVTSPFTGSRNLTAQVIVLQVPPPATVSFSQQIKPYLIYIVLIVVIVVAVVSFFFFTMWRRKRGAASAAAAAATEETQPYDELEDVPGAGDPNAPDDGQPPSQALGRGSVAGPFRSSSSTHSGRAP